MSLEVWMKKGTKITVGGRELILLPLPLSNLIAIGHWLEDNCNDVVQEIVVDLKKGEQAPNPFSLIAKVLLRVNVSQIALVMFDSPKDPLTKKKLNDGLTVEFFEEYLDIPTAHELFNKFVEINQLEDLIKNLSRLPLVKKLIEAGTLAYGIPFLNSLQPSTVSAPKESEGSLSHRSMDTSTPATSEEQEAGSYPNQPPNPTEEKPRKKSYLQ